MKLNVNSMRQRLQKLEQYINELEKQQPVTLESFKSDFTLQIITAEEDSDEINSSPIDAHTRG